ALEPERLETRNPLQPRLAARVRRVHVAVEHQRRPAAGARPGTEDVRAPFLHLLPLDFQPELAEGAGDPGGHRLLGPGEAGNGHRRDRVVHQPLLVDVQVHQRTRGSTCSPNNAICWWRRSPHSSSMTCVQPASRYSSIAATHSSGVPAMGLHLSRISSVTCSFAARRPPRSIASATGRISSCVKPAKSSSVSAAPRMFCTLFARYMPAISRAPSRPASRSDSWI